MKTMSKTLVMGLVLGASLLLVSCGHNTDVEKSMVMIWASETVEEPLAYGLVVGDGTQIVTILDSGTVSSPNLYIGVLGKTRYPVTGKVTGAWKNVVILEITENIFPPASVSGEHFDEWGTTVIMHGWVQGNPEKMDRREIVFVVDGGSGEMKDTMGPYNDTPGAVITKKNGQIIGLLGIPVDPIILGGPGSTNPMIDIHDALVLLLQVKDN